MYKVCKLKSVKELLQEYQLAIHCVKLLANGIIIDHHTTMQMNLIQICYFNKNVFSHPCMSEAFYYEPSQENSLEKTSVGTLV
jgi:hypothetical protein